MEKIVEKVKKYRVKIDKLFTVMGGMEKSREISIAITSAQNGKMWLGKVLQRLDQPNPYPESKNASNTKIEPTADTWVGDLERELKGIGHIQKAKQLRQELTSIYEELESDKDSIFSEEMDVLLFHFLLKSYDYIVESNMWLGMELGRVNKEVNK